MTQLSAGCQDWVRQALRCSTVSARSQDLAYPILPATGATDAKAVDLTTKEVTRDTVLEPMLNTAGSYVAILKPLN